LKDGIRFRDGEIWRASIKSDRGSGSGGMTWALGVGRVLDNSVEGDARAINRVGLIARQKRVEVRGDIGSR
jgi:hypothetical protein